jgi:DNA-binding response OmpR family regulator
MRKIIVVGDTWMTFRKKRSFLDREYIKLQTAVSNAEALALHRVGFADLIIVELDSPGMSGEILCSEIRESLELRHVSIIIVCPGNSASIERAMKCRANEVLARPVNPETLLLELQRLLNIAVRTSLRVPIAVKVFGKFHDRSIIGHTMNISSSGILIESRTRMEDGDIIVCSFPLPGNGQVRAEAEVVRAVINESGNETNRYGLRFSNMSADAFSAIEAFLEEKAWNA